MSDLNPITRALQLHRQAGRSILDLTVSNPTVVGLPYPENWLHDLGKTENVFPYLPDSLGALPAREAVARYLNEQGVSAHADNVVLASGTSEAYSWIFRLIAAPGDEIITMTPGYPLCDALAEWCGLNLLAWNWRFDEAKSQWVTDWNKLEQSLTNRSRALVLINPNNPTGQYLTSHDWQSVLAMAERHDLAVIVDTVFWDYRLAANGPDPMPVSTGPMVFVLGGLSKTCGLPQMKLAWLHLQGDIKRVAVIREKLAWVADIFLSVNTPAQNVLPRILADRHLWHNTLVARIRENLGVAQELLSNLAMVLAPQGGWCLTIRLPHHPDDEATCLELLEKHEVLVQPGYFFDFPQDGYLMISLITSTSEFRQGLNRIADFLRSQVEEIP
jgi:alanine-synthesizing transaminase